MSGNAQKIPFAGSISEYTQRRIEQAISATGRGLPASVVSQSSGRGVVVVKFELTNTGLTLPNVTIPVAGAEWIRWILPSGTKGVVIPFDAPIGNMSGLGAQTSNLARGANLSSLIFQPIGNSNFADPGEPNRTVIYGPDGAVLSSSINKEFFVRVTSTEIDIQNAAGTVQIKAFGAELDLTAPTVKLNGVVQVNGALQLSGSIQNIGGGSYSGNFTTTGDVVAGTISLKTHRTTGVQTGVGISGVPTP